MKVESVIKINLNGEYEVVYVGADRGVARQIYKDLMNKKEESLRAVIDELKYENRKFEFGSKLYRLEKRIEAIEEQLGIKIQKYKN